MPALAGLAALAGSRDDDGLLLAASAAGDARAFRALVDRHAGQAYAVALRLTASPADAEDVVQEAFLRVWRHAASWRAGGSARFGTWLFRVVLNLCRDAARARRARPHEPLEAAAEVADPGPGAEARLARDRAVAALLATVAGLPARQRAAVVLTYAGGLSNGETARVLGVSVGAVESLLVRARCHLRARLPDPGRSGRDDA